MVSIYTFKQVNSLLQLYQLLTDLAEDDNNPKKMSSWWQQSFWTLPLRWGAKKVDMELCLVFGISTLVWVKLRATAKLYPPPPVKGLSSLEMGRASRFWNTRCAE